MVGFVWLSLLVSILLMTLLPLLFGQLMVASLAKLHLDPASAVFVVFAIILGSFVNIPVRRMRRSNVVSVHPLAAFGLAGFLPQLRRVRQTTVVAINVGGCVVPAAVAVYELLWLSASEPGVLWALALTAAVNTGICYKLARPVGGIGITLPGLVPALTAAALALWLAPTQAAPVAFVAGVAGPLIGADLLHLREVESAAVGVLSIGGAGTFDGIVLSGIIAAYLA